MILLPRCRWLLRSPVRVRYSVSLRATLRSTRVTFDPLQTKTTKRLRVHSADPRFEHSVEDFFHFCVGLLGEGLPIFDALRMRVHPLRLGACRRLVRNDVFVRRKVHSLMAFLA